MKDVEDNFLPDFDEGYGVVDDQEEAYIMHTLKDVDSIIQEIGIDLVMRGLNDYSKEQMVKWLAKNY